ncbi:hypothetical protein LP415_16635 [Polaromonas sp. P1(28)-8]|nr:hypothetical protein LP415_16635 [Polaromonas sp. P1(28)-8]
MSKANNVVDAGELDEGNGLWGVPGERNALGGTHDERAAGWKSASGIDIRFPTDRVSDLKLDDQVTGRLALSSTTLYANCTDGNAGEHGAYELEVSVHVFSFGSLEVGSTANADCFDVPVLGSVPEGTYLCCVTPNVVINKPGAAS